MSISHVANRGTTSSKSASKTISRSPTATLAVGSLVLVWCCWDNNNTGTPDNGPISEQLSCRDSVGNVWTTVVGGQNRGSPTAQGNGVQGAIHICRLVHAITTSDTITVRLGTGNSLVAKAMSIEEFALSGSSYRWCLSSFGAAIDVAADPQSLSATGPGSGIEALYIHILTAEAPDTDSYTWDSDYTQISGIGTTGGADDSNVHVRGGYRITTLSSDTINVTSDTADRDYWQAWASLYEYRPLPFPTTPLLDDFNRANEDPLSKSGAWHTADVVHGGTVGLAVSSNQCKAGSTSTANRGQWWEAPYARNQEAWVTCVVAATGVDDGFGVGLLGVFGNAAKGVRCYWIKFPAEDAASDDAVIIGLGDADSIQRVMHSWYPMTNGVKLGLKLAGLECAMHVDIGNGWEWVSAFRTDNADGPYLSLLARDQVVRLDDFGGGSPRRSGFIRRPWRYQGKELAL